MPTCTVLAAAPLVMTGARLGLTRTCTTRVPAPLPLLAPRVTVKSPAWLGVPLSSPVLLFTPRPAGRPEAMKLPAVMGGLVASIWMVLMAVPWVPITLGAARLVDSVGVLVITGAPAEVTVKLTALV